MTGLLKPELTELGHFVVHLGHHLFHPLAIIVIAKSIFGRRL